MKSILHKSIIVVLIISGVFLFFGCAPASSPVPSIPASSPSPTPPSTPSSSPTSAQSVTINLTAENMAFNTDTITVPAGANVTVVFENKDRVPHNLAVYTEVLGAGEGGSQDQIIFRGEVFSGPRTMNYQFSAPSAQGTYFFRCDPHPNIMTGSFVVSG